jgi:hypothetical protein
MRGKRPASGEAGIAFLATLILLLFLGALGTALTGMVHARVETVTLEVDRLQALYLAEAGLARALQEISNSRDLFGNDGIGIIAPTAYGRGFFQVGHDPDSRSLVGWGVVGDIRRVIVYRYQ